MKRLLTILIMTLMCWSLLSYADGVSSLTLTASEMQKLKKYFPEDENTHLIWKGDPISVQLPIGKEKRLVFSDHVTVDLKGALNTDQLRLLNNDQSIYLTALTTFPSTRIYVTLQSNGKVILIDLSSIAEGASNAAQYIDVKDSNVISHHPQPMATTTVSYPNPDENQEEASEPDDVTYVDLIRFAWKEMLAPRRLLKNSPHYMRAAMHTEPFITNLVYGDKVIAHPEGAWMGGGHYVTVVSLQNKYPHQTKIDIRNDLCGTWEAATLYPRSILKPQGERKGDSTILFLVSQKPFGETGGVCHGDA